MILGKLEDLGHKDREPAITRSELANLRVCAFRFMHIFGSDSAAGKIVGDLLAALDECEREAATAAREKVS